MIDIDLCNTWKNLLEQNNFTKEVRVNKDKRTDLNKKIKNEIQDAKDFQKEKDEILKKHKIKKDFT